MIIINFFGHNFKILHIHESQNLKRYFSGDIQKFSSKLPCFLWSNYELDPAWYYTAPGLAWDAALKMTKVELEMLTDIQMLDMFEEGIRGGISSIMHRHAKANNKNMGKYFNPENPSKYLVYLDANNLCGWAMSETLPTKGFKWMTEEELQDWSRLYS